MINKMCNECKSTSKIEELKKVEIIPFSLNKTIPIYKCLKGHDLEFQQMKNKPNSSISFCDKCEKTIKSNKMIWNCSLCNFNICWNCRKPHDGLNKTCLNNHLLHFSRSHHDYLENKYRCSECGKSNYPLDMGRYFCWECDYNLCWKCLIPEKEYLSIVSRCPRNHELNWDKGDFTNNDLFWNCAACNERGEKQIKRWKCNSCNFNLCNSCKGIDEAFVNASNSQISEIEIGKNQKSTCKICKKYKINVVLIPCGHLCVCSLCCYELNFVCIVCKEKVNSFLRLYYT